MDDQLHTLLQDLAVLMAIGEDDSSMSSDISVAQLSGASEEPENDARQASVGVRRSSWIQSVTFAPLKSPGDILNASDEQLYNFTKFLTVISYHVSFNDEVRALGDLPCDQFRIAYSALHYLSLGDDKTELQVEKFMNHHCGGVRLSIAVHLVRS